MILRVPIRIDGLYVETETLELGLPMANFSKLPYNVSNGTFNSDFPNLAEIAFNAELGQANGVTGKGLFFPKGLHLHWALPDALTTGHHRHGERTKFPPVPNRWLVRRLDHAGTLQKSWIVESDFLHPFDKYGKPTVEPPNGITAWPKNQPITFPTKRHELSKGAGGAAFRFMGHSLLLSDWLHRKENTGDYLNQDANSRYKLTALGYGEPAFAAYYPNCYSVFGFCDIDPDPATSYEYQVIGWFNEVDLDPLQSPDFAGLESDAARYDALQQEYRWSVTQDDRQKSFPQLTVCFASLTITPNNVKPWQSQGAVDLAIGNTGGEALSALLADEVATPQQSDDKITIEDQLEAMNVAAALQGVEVDYKAHFFQTRHQRGFRGVAGGSRWAVLPNRPKPDSAADATQDAVPPLPDSVAHALDALNVAQEAYDMAQQEIVELRYQTFCDWHKFLVAFYSDKQSLVPFTRQSSNLADFINQQDLTLLNEKVGKAGKLVLEKDTATAEGKTTTTLILATNALEPKNPSNDTFAVQVILRLNALINTLFETQIHDEFEIVNQPAEHFWRPNEPVVLLSGPVAVSTARHGDDGDLPCAVLDLPGAPGTEAFINAVGTLKPSNPNDPGIQTQSSSPWHPIILEWSVQVSPVSTGRTPNHNTDNKTLDYEASFISASFNLNENQPDFDLPKSLDLHSSNTYQGRCLMTPAASTQLDTNLRTFLIKTTLDDCRDRTAKEPDYVNRLIAWYLTKHNVTPPAKDSEKGPWLKQQKPFVEDKKDANGNPVLFPVAELETFYSNKPVAGGANHTVGNSWDHTQQAQDPIYSAIRALSQLEGKLVLSQALGGFNAALITRNQVLQIPIEDPMGADDDLTAAVAAAVGPRHPMAPVSGNVFNPIRSGTLSLAGLRLMDTFGQQWNASLAGANVVTSNSLSNPYEKNQIYLPPRLSAPARLNFRWLAAMSGQNETDEVEMNSAPATTPICGWLLPNNFDNSVMVYDTTGVALGSINTLAEWTPAPGGNDRISAAEIPNPHLRRLVRRLIVTDAMPQDQITIRQHFLEGFLSTLDSSIEAIEPADFAQHEALALFMGRPIAVVRARVDLQLMGQTMDRETFDDPTIRGGHAHRLRKSRYWQAFAAQDWDVFAYDWGQFYGCSYDEIENQKCLFNNKGLNYARTTHGFEKVVIPMRLGEHQLLNDGLVGFWEETAAGELNNVFHAPQTLKDVEITDDVIFKPGRTTPCIRPYADGMNDNLSVTLEDDPLALTILMDPRGVIHATSGILPVHKLEIPPAYYAHALKSMGVTFRVSPLVTDAEQLHAALPKEAGYVWSWITKTNVNTWEETAAITDATEQAHFFKPPKIVEGWLKLTPRDEEQE